MNKEEKFKIDKNKLNEIVEIFQQRQSENRSPMEEERLTNHYRYQIVKVLGNEKLVKAIGIDALNFLADRILRKEKMHFFYEDADTLNMIEGLSNNEIIGDWQHFLSVKSDFLFSLPEKQQEEVARNFAIGNISAQKCLMELWKNKIKTSGTDVMRAEVSNSTNNITIVVPIERLSYCVETLAKGLPREKTFIGASISADEDEKIIAMHSADSNFFDNIRAVAPYLRNDSVNKKKFQEIPNSYFQKVQKEASSYDIDILNYLNIHEANKYDERVKEQMEIELISSSLSQQQIKGLQDRIKNVSRTLFQKVSDFMGRAKITRGREKEEK